MIIKKLKELKRAAKFAARRFSPEYEKVWKERVEPVARELVEIMYGLDALQNFVRRALIEPIGETNLDAFLYGIDDWIKLLE